MAIGAMLERYEKFLSRSSFGWYCTYLITCPYLITMPKQSQCSFAFLVSNFHCAFLFFRNEVQKFWDREWLEIVLSDVLSQLSLSNNFKSLLTKKLQGAWVVIIKQFSINHTDLPHTPTLITLHPNTNPVNYSSPNQPNDKLRESKKQLQWAVKNLGKILFNVNAIICNEAHSTAVTISPTNVKIWNSKHQAEPNPHLDLYWSRTISGRKYGMRGWTI